MAAVVDFFDGLCARLLRAYSEIGKQLDSLSDMVSFGVAPAAMLYNEISNILSPRISMGFDTLGWEILTYAPFVLTLFAALRLAKFNVDVRQREVFLGLPTPAGALFIASFLMYAKTHIALDPFISVGSILLTVVVLSLLMVANVPMLAMKFKGFSWAPNAKRYVFIAICVCIVLLTAVLQEEFTLSIVLVILSYIVYSLILNLLPLKSKF
jgi:CDP-diacylglycerol--serine O-phosphatidyltransferase